MHVAASVEPQCISHVIVETYLQCPEGPPRFTVLMHAAANEEPQCILHVIVEVSAVSRGRLVLQSSCMLLPMRSPSAYCMLLLR